MGSNVRTRRSAKAWELREAKKKAKDKKEEESSQVPVVPMAGAVVIASVLGGPVCLMAGIKLGMVAALGGGIMGYTTGRLIEEHGETESLLKGEYMDVDQEEVGVKAQSSKKRMLKRIEEYERFEANCQRLRQQRAIKKNKKTEKERGEREKRSYSLDTGRRELSSLEVSLTLEEKMSLWRREDGGRSYLEGSSLRRQSYQMARRNSLPALVEETEEESVSTKRRSKSIDSFVII